MPRGFNDIASGTSLSSKLQEISQSFLDGLKKLSEQGKVTSASPMTNAEIRRKFASVGVSLSGDEIRALVNYWRRRGERIISTNAGYFVTNSWQEAEPWVKSLIERTNAQIQAVNGLLAAFGKEKGQIDLL